MLEFICGEVVDVLVNEIIVKNNGIGYGLTVSEHTKMRVAIGDNVQLFCYLQVKEDSLALFGFATAEEKQLFKHLISVSGVGPKLAISILSGMPVNQLAICIVTANTATLCSIKGLGKKTAEKIILELREKLQLDKYEQVAIGSDVNAEAVEVLRSLGVMRKDAVERVKAAMDNGMTTTEQILNYALRNY